MPEAELIVGEMQQLPYDDDTFDLVTGFNSFFFAADLSRRWAKADASRRAERRS